MQYSPKGMDSAYLAAVDRGDTETAQKTVDDAAKRDDGLMVYNIGQMKKEAFPKLTALPETPALSEGMLLITVYPLLTGMSTPSFPRKEWTASCRSALASSSLCPVRTTSML